MNPSQFSVNDQQSEMSATLVTYVVEQYHMTYYYTLFNKEKASLVLIYRATIAREQALSRSKFNRRSIFLESNKSLGELLSVL